MPLYSVSVTFLYHGTQHGIDPARAKSLETILPVRYVQANPGSVLFFHCNLLHASEPNVSKYPRLSYICCYNALSNVPIVGTGHGPPRPIELTRDDAVLKFA